MPRLRHLSLLFLVTPAHVLCMFSGDALADALSVQRLKIHSFLTLILHFSSIKICGLKVETKLYLFFSQLCMAVVFFLNSDPHFWKSSLTHPKVVWLLAVRTTGTTSNPALLQC